MKTKTIQKRILRLNRILLVAALFFVALSFAGVYMSSISEIEMLYLNLAKAILVVDLVFMAVCNELMKEEKSKFKYKHEYTFMVNRK